MLTSEALDFIAVRYTASKITGLPFFPRHPANNSNLLFLIPSQKYHLTGFCLLFLLESISKMFPKGFQAISQHLRFLLRVNAAQHI